MLYFFHPIHVWNNDCGLLLQLEVFQKGLDPSEVAGDFGNHSLYKNLGYFSLIGLLRLHTQLGDYYNALDSVKNVTISKKVSTVA